MRRPSSIHVVLALVAVSVVGVPVCIAATSSDDLRSASPEAVDEQLVLADPSAGGALPAPPLRVPVEAETPLEAFEAHSIDVADPPSVDFTLPLPGEGISAASALVSDSVDEQPSQTVAFSVKFVARYERGGDSYAVQVLVPSDAARANPLLLGERTIGSAQGRTVFGADPDVAALASGNSVITVRGGVDDRGRLELLNALRLEPAR